MMTEIFDFDKIRSQIKSNFSIRFDAMSAVGGPYAKHILENVLGAPKGTVVNAEPLKDFGGLHPDPNPVNAAELVAHMTSDEASEFGAASDGDADRNMIVGRQVAVAPSDSLAIMAANAKLIPEVPKEEAFALGIMGINKDRTITEFVEKPLKDAPTVPEKPYWRDVGTVDAFWEANLDLAANMPELNLYDKEWPIWTAEEQLPPAKFVPDLEVSPTYAKEIQTQAQGCGLDGLLSSRKGDLYGVLNGVDPKVWSPKSDEYIKAQYNAKTVVTGVYAEVRDILESNGKDVSTIEGFEPEPSLGNGGLASSKTAINGEWVEAPGYAFFDAVYAAIPDANIVAEDLGDLREESVKLQEKSLLLHGVTP
ncbi:hypothetical protein EGW08_023515 [Elysia chlorotica]|uniref:Alpha-D-phosphohexomutase alpha/beta/alpha domain-containing protein n=1 Tax=Elysia chlorotica TaxID=188477 RepID=A0A3S1BJI6_ELYCH|nr:hypothetical protein EGW08_023515 [Elysia chlorotica]